jgi:N-acylneuraminate cytidylyltransferase
LAAERVDAVYVSTDDEAIAQATRLAGGQVLSRPTAIAGDEASSETALLHGLDQLAEQGHRPEVLLFVQCTSPFIDSRDLDRAAALVLEGRADATFSGVATYEFLWRDAHPSAEPGSGAMVGVNHDAAVRPRRQDRRPDFKETGAFYAMSTAGFRRHRHRFFGRTTVVNVAELTAIEIDTPADLVVAEALAAVADSSPPPPVEVDAVITDFDGVHTADTAYVDETGHESVRVSRSDGLGIGRLRAAGIPMLILSRERNPVVTARAQKLSVEVLQGVEDKAPAVRSWLSRHGIAAERAAYVGNDINDLGAMRVVGWPVAVSDAHPEVLAAARLTLTRPGGRGAVRQLCDLVLAAHAQAAAADVELVQPPPTREPAAPVAADAGPSTRVGQPV